MFIVAFFLPVIDGMSLSPNSIMAQRWFAIGFCLGLIDAVASKLTHRLINCHIEGQNCVAN